MKIEHLEIVNAAIQSQIKDEMMQEFQNLTPEEGREMVRISGVLLLLDLDIADALVFKSIYIKLDILDQRVKCKVSNFKLCPQLQKT